METNVFIATQIYTYPLELDKQICGKWNNTKEKNAHLINSIYKNKDNVVICEC